MLPATGPRSNLTAGSTGLSEGDELMCCFFFFFTFSNLCGFFFFFFLFGGMQILLESSVSFVMLEIFPQKVGLCTLEGVEVVPAYCM